MDDPDGMRALLERIRLAVCQRPFDAGGLAVTVTVRVGGALGTANSKPEELLAQADRALYVAKARGRNCVVLS